MINTLFARANVVARFQQSLLQPHLSDLAGMLHEHGYSRNIIRAYLSSAEKFGQWLSISNLNTSDVNEDLIARESILNRGVRFEENPAQVSSRYDPTSSAINGDLPITSGAGRNQSDDLAAFADFKRDQYRPTAWIYSDCLCLER
jgi:hypothetical protein